jgi:hypothetical protein
VGWNSAERRTRKDDKHGQKFNFKMKCKTLELNQMFKLKSLQAKSVYWPVCLIRMRWAHHYENSVIRATLTGAAVPKTKWCGVSNYETCTTRTGFIVTTPELCRWGPLKFPISI